jgi:probable HAF family extracellular repeat protein
VGEYVGSDRAGPHGYIEVGDSFTTLDVTGAAFTILGGLNNSGEVVGTYAVNDIGLFGFLESNGKFTSLSIPGANEVFANAINDSGEIVGTFLDTSGKLHGFLYQNGAFTVFNYPGALDTWAQGINDEGDIVGYFQTAVPDPSSLLLVFIGLIGLGTARLCVGSRIPMICRRSSRRGDLIRGQPRL